MSGRAQVAMLVLVGIHVLAALAGVIVIGLGEPRSPMYAPHISDAALSSALLACVGTCLASGLLGMLVAWSAGRARD